MTLPADECLDHPNHHGVPCSGAVEYRMSLSGTGTAIPRCDAHWERRLEEQERINETYGAPDSDVAPSWFHAGWGGENEYGERWSDDY
jgi:hypothetical protein